jgi:hypothetical protein
MLWRESHGMHWLARLARLELGDHLPESPIVCVPGCPVQPDNMMETVLYLPLYVRRAGTQNPPRRRAASVLLFGSTVHEGCDRGGYYEQAEFAESYESPLCIAKLECWDLLFNATSASAGGCAELAAARTWAEFASRARCPDSPTNSCPHESALWFSLVIARCANLRTRHPGPAPFHPGLAQQRT